MTDRLAAIRAIIAAQPGPSRRAADYLERVCRAAARTLSASGTGISLLTADGARGICAASDPYSEQIEELQFTLGEGPCIDAFASRRPVLVPDLASGAAARWPAYCPAVHDGGIRAVFAFPLQIGAARLGVLDVFRKRPGALSDDQLRDALAFADVAMAALLDQQDAAAGADEGPAEWGDYRPELFQAQGMVMVQIGGTIGEAMARMRAYAYAENRRLIDVARDVVAHRLQFDRDRR